MNDELVLKVAQSKAAHWYHEDGTPQHTIDGANGNERNTNLRDARKYGLYPSVTGVDSDVLTNFGVTRWKENILIEAAYTLPVKPDEEYGDFCDRVKSDADQFGSVAREFGSKIHAAIDCFHMDRDFQPEPELLPWFEKYKAWFNANIIDVVSSEKRVVNKKVGYAGTMDMVARHQEYGTVLIDFKTQNMKSAKPNFYDSWVRQLAAYRECVDPKPQCLSVVINSKEPMDPFEKLWTDQETKTGWDVFKRACEIWQLQRNYFPGGEE